MTGRYDHTAATAAYRGSTRHSLILGWTFDRPAEIAFLLGEPGGTSVEWWLDRWQVAGGIDRPVIHNGAKVWPAVGPDPGFVAVRPTLASVAFRVPEGALGRFVAKTEALVQPGFEQRFHADVERMHAGVEAMLREAA